MDSNQIKGQRTRARMATGQQKTSKTHHKSKVFTSDPLHSYWRLYHTLTFVAAQRDLKSRWCEAAPFVFRVSRAP
jgi:hypothetical protein